MSEISIVNPVSVPNTAGQMGKKPPHLIEIDEKKSGTKKLKFFIAINKPDFSSAPGFVLTTGFFTNEVESKIKKTFWELIKNEPKENFEEIHFPTSRVVNVKSLVFRAK